MDKFHMNTSPSPLSLTASQWLRKAARLKPQDLVNRIWALASSLPRNILAVRRLQKQVAREGKKLRCIILTDRLGDIIAAEPVARHLRTASEHLVWLVQPRYQDLLRYNPNIDTVQTVSSYTETLLLRRLFKNILWSDLHFDGYHCDRFGMRAHNPNRQGLNAQNYYNFGTLTDVFAITGTGQKIAERPKIYPDPSFNTSTYLHDIFVDAKKPLLIIQIRSDDSTRSWSVDSAITTVQWLLEHTDYNIIETGLSPALMANKRVHLLSGHLPLSTQMAIISKANLFIGVDSGFAHIANAAGIPSILLLGAFGPFTQHLPWKLGEHDIAIRSQNLPKTITSGAVVAALQKLI